MGPAFAGKMGIGASSPEQSAQDVRLTQ